MSSWRPTFLESDEEDDDLSSPLPDPPLPSSLSSVPPSLPSKKEKPNKNKIGKKSKRIEKEKQKEIEGREKVRLSR